MNRAVLMTGATGFVGGEFLTGLIGRDPETKVYCLVRARDAKMLEARRQALLGYAGIYGPEADRVVAVAGDVTKLDLGLGSVYARLARDVHEVYHLAASTKFDLSLDDARATNLDGAAHVLEFARQAQKAGGLRRLHHLSTAYIVGGRAGVLCEDDVPEAPAFRNTYEQTKWESERLLDPATSDVPTTCYRPSVIVGDSHTGRTLHFRVLYDPMRWIYSGKVAILPCRPDVRLDVVPVDYVCDALLALSERNDTEGKTYHLTAGPEGAMSIAELVEQAVAVANRYHEEIGADPVEPPVIVSPDLMSQETAADRAKSDQLFAAGRAIMSTHVPYMLTEQLFDSSRADDALRSLHISCPALRSYYGRIVRWGIERSFSSS